MDGTLFDVEPIIPPPVEKLSADRRRTQLQLTRLHNGTHPLSGVAGHRMRLHEQAAPVDDRKAPGRRCGNCHFRELLAYHDDSYPKCTFGYQQQDGSKPRGRPPLVTNSAASDVRAWWPACRDHEYGDPKLSNDAARWVPEVTT